MHVQCCFSRWWHWRILMGYLKGNLTNLKKLSKITPTKSRKHGKNRSAAEIQGVFKHGMWIFINGKEFFLPFDRYPWFQKATIKQIYDFKLLRGNHLYWKSLDIDLDIESLKNPAAYPLIAKQ